MALNLNDDEEDLQLFKNSNDEGSGLKPKPNTDVLNGIQYANGLVAEAVHEDIGAWEDVNDMTDTFVLDHEGKALVIFTGKFLMEADLADTGVGVRIDVDGSEVAGTERTASTDYYTDHTGEQDLLTGGNVWFTMSISKIISLTPGSHTIKIQAKELDGDDASIVDAGERTMDILVWIAPPGK